MSLLTLSEKVEKFTSSLGRPQNDEQNSAFDHLVGLDFPTSREEYWKYTRVGKIANGKFNLPSKGSENIELSKWLISSNYIVLENGLLREDLSQYPEDVTIELLDPEHRAGININEDDIFTALNSCYYDKVLRLSVPANVQLAESVQLLLVGNDQRVMSSIRLSVEMGRSSSAELITTTFTASGSGNFTNVVSDFHLAENSLLIVSSLQAENESSLSVNTVQVRQERDSHFSMNTITLQGLLVRNNINIAVAGENCETHLNGAVVANGSMHVDNHTFVDHLVSNCFSNENYKYVLDDLSTGVFNGKVVVRPDAQQINAYQNNGNILLSDTSHIYSKPELEIYADDVKCSHGSTTGQLDENAMFYLQTRGISKENAKKMLVAAFIGEVIQKIRTQKFIELVHQGLRDFHQWKF